MKVTQMDLSKTLKKDMEALALALGVKVTPRMTKQQLVNLTNVAARREDLALLARSLGLKVTTRMTKQQLMAMCGPALCQQQAVAGVSAESSPVKPMPAPVKAASMPPKEPEIELPWRYNEDRLVLLPVNPGMVYGYWELTGDTIAGLVNARQITAYKLVLNLYVIEDGGAPYVKQTLEIDAFGEYYFRHYLAGSIVWLELGLEDQHNTQHPLLYSQKTQMPMDHISESEESLYLTVLENADGKRTLVFSGQPEQDNADGVFMTDPEPFPKLGY